VPTPELVVSDYELALLQAMSRAFPGARSRGCHYHSGVFLPIINWIHLYYCLCFIFKFTQAIYQYAARIGLTAAYRENEAVRRLIKMAIALALLPPRLVWDGFQVTENKKCNFSFGFYIIFYLQRLSNNVWKNYPIMLDLRRESN
jgi:hypothetical protein